MVNRNTEGRGAKLNQNQNQDVAGKWKHYSTAEQQNQRTLGFLHLRLTLEQLHQPGHLYYQAGVKPCVIMYYF